MLGELRLKWRQNVNVSSTATAATHVSVKCITTSGSQNWKPAEFRVDYAVAAGAPEMEVWALLVILPMMFYVAYRSSENSDFQTA